MRVDAWISLAGVAATLAVVWFTRKMSASQARAQARQAPQAMVTSVELCDAERLRVEVVVVNCAPHPMALKRVRVHNTAGNVAAEVDYPQHTHTQAIAGLHFSRRESIRSVLDQVMLTVRIPRTALPAMVEVDTTTGCASTEPITEDDVPTY